MLKKFIILILSWVNFTSTVYAKSITSADSVALQP